MTGPVTATGHPRVCVNPMCTFGLPVPDEVALLSSLGVAAAGAASRKLAEYGWEPAVRALAAADFAVPYLVHAVLTPVGDATAWSSERELMLRAVDAAHRLGAGVLYFCSGPPGDLTWEQAADALAERLAPVATEAVAAGVTLAVENSISLRTDISFVHTLRDAVRLARALGIGVCADLYCCWVEPALARTLIEAHDVIRLVQVSDFVVGTLCQPDRAVPGDGDLPLRRLLADVVASGYTGVFDLELLGPRIEAEGAESVVRRATAWLSAALRDLGVDG